MPSPSPIVQCATTTLTVTLAYDSSDAVTGASVFLSYAGQRISIINEALLEQVTNATGVSGTFLVADNNTNGDAFDDQLGRAGGGGHRGGAVYAAPAPAPQGRSHDVGGSSWRRVRPWYALVGNAWWLLCSSSPPMMMPHGEMLVDASAASKLR